MAQVRATCDTADEDYNGYRATYSQLCPETCGACDSHTEPECHRPDVCCCEEDQGVDCASDEAAKCVRRCSQCITDPEGGDADGEQKGPQHRRLAERVGEEVGVALGVGEGRRRRRRRAEERHDEQEEKNSQVLG